MQAIFKQFLTSFSTLQETFPKLKKVKLNSLDWHVIIKKFFYRAYYKLAKEEKVVVTVTMQISELNKNN